MRTGLRKLVLCADDFGQSEAISAGILDLIAARRLTATSVMSEAPYWPAAAIALARLQQQADIGLHLNLTHPFPAAGLTRPLTYWLGMSSFRLLSRTRLRDKFILQIDAFTRELGRLPDFIDGHQHVHAFPVIRSALTDAIAARWPQHLAAPYLRAPDLLIDGGDTPAKALVLRLACRGFARHAKQHRLQATQHFGGVYSLQPEAGFPDHMQHWLRSAPNLSLLMCHPGRADADPADPIHAARIREYQYLSSPAFLHDCEQAGVRLCRFGELAS
jgi:predicted glycoside hydrolase/deacetylase ChbG (UPF0249 family)